MNWYADHSLMAYNLRSMKFTVDDVGPFSDPLWRFVLGREAGRYLRRTHPLPGALHIH